MTVRSIHALVGGADPGAPHAAQPQFKPLRGTIFLRNDMPAARYAPSVREGNLIHRKRSPFPMLYAGEGFGGRVKKAPLYRGSRRAQRG